MLIFRISISLIFRIHRFLSLCLHHFSLNSQGTSPFSYCDARGVPSIFSNSNLCLLFINILGFSSSAITLSHSSPSLSLPISLFSSTSLSSPLSLSFPPTASSYFLIYFIICFSWKFFSCVMQFVFSSFLTYILASSHIFLFPPSPPLFSLDSNHSRATSFPPPVFLSYFLEN